MIKEIANFRNEKGQYTSMVIDKNIKSVVISNYDLEHLIVIRQNKNQFMFVIEYILKNAREETLKIKSSIVEVYGIGEFILNYDEYINELYKKYEKEKVEFFINKFTKRLINNSKHWNFWRNSNVFFHLYEQNKF